MRLRIRLFAAFREAVGQNELSYEAPDGATAGAVVSRLSSEYPRLGSAVKNAMLAANLEYVGPDHQLHDGDELALIPPVSGGSAAPTRPT
jgi:molybdopterin converting factor subunit 1